MSKKRWKQPNEFLWTLVFMVGFFMMSADSFAVLLLALGVMGISVLKLRGIDLEEECNSGLHFNNRQSIDMAGNNRNMENRIKIPFIDTLASTKGIKNKHMRFSNSNRKRGASQTWRKQYAIHAQTDVAATQWTGAGEWLAQIIRKRRNQIEQIIRNRRTV